MKNLFVPVLLMVLTTWAVSSPDMQTMMAEEAAKDGVILVRNDTSYPIEVRKEDVGKKGLLCLAQDLKTADLIPVTKLLFPGTRLTVLIRCRDGKLYFSPGSVWKTQTKSRLRTLSSSGFHNYFPATIFERTLSCVLRCLSSFGRRISSRPCFSWASASSITTSSGSTSVRVKPPQKSSRWK